MKTILAAFGLLTLALLPTASAVGDSVVVVNELHYNPTNAALEFVELHNQLSVDVDMSGWRFDGGITFAFAERTVIPARGYLVVAKDPAALQAATGFAGAKGPFTGTLSNDGETLKLWNNNAALRTRPNSASVPAAGEIWSVDIQGDGAGGAFGQTSPVLMSGAEAASGFGNVWNALTVAGHSGTTVNPSLAVVKDSTGANTSVAFSITGTVSGWSSPGNALNTDYMFLAAGNSASSVTWQLTGLNPAKTYSVWLYGSSSRSCRFKVDINGNGSIGDETAVTAPANGGVLVSGIQPDATGKIIGNADTPGGEVNWSGFQLFVPSNGSAPPFDPGAFNSSLEKRRLMDEFSYGDSGKWPVGPDGSGFTLAKLDAQGGGQAVNWTTSAQVNGTPGAANLITAGPSVALNEVSGASDATFRLELYNYGANSVALDGWQIVNGDTAAAYTFPVSSLAAGAYLTLEETTMGFRPLNNARLFLRSPTRMADAAKVATTPRARQTAGTGRWLRPSAATFGAANTFVISGDVVIHEIFHTAFDTSPEQWVELKNRGAASVNIGGWKLTDGISYTFPVGTTIGAGQYLVVAADGAALLAKYPGRTIIGNFSGGLGDTDDITLEDVNGNPADEVEYFSEGRWPEYADRGGASMELRDADADNAQPEAWAASSTAALGAWQTISYSGVAIDDGLGDDAFRDFMLGMLESGEVLIDDVSVRENPAGANTEFIQNGTFQADALGAEPLKWRCIGNHGQGRSVVIADPDNASNKCLRVVATGNTEDKNNRIETTFFTGRQVTVGNTYQISFRARWMAGSNQVNTRLYFNYLQRTTLLNVGTQWGTPGLANSAAIANLGPTFSGLAHSPAVPAASGSVSVSARLADPDNIASAALFYRVASGGWLNVAMTLGADGRHSAAIGGQTAGALVQFYVRGTDGLGAVADFPAGGAAGGAFYRVANGDADLSGLRGNLRVLISPENETVLFTNTNRMSNDTFPATIIEDESTIYYGSRMRLKGSAFGRYSATEFGYGLDFPPEQPFRGVHTSVSIERAGNMKELVAKHILNRAGGGYWSQFDDVARINGPGVASIALIAASRTTSVFLKSIFPDEPAGTVFNHELLYQPNGTVTPADPETLKLNNPYNHTRGTYDLADRGADKEAYRWGWQIRSKRRDDDYSSIVRLNRAFALSGSAFTSEVDATIDVDQWMRTWAIMGLYGNDDQFGRAFAHNWRLVQRPTDGRLIALPWDLDRAFNLATTAQLTPTAFAIQNLFAVTAYKRQFDSHVLDLVNTTFNATYLNPWLTHLTTVTGETTEFSGIPAYVTARSNFALTQLPASVAFAITTNGGADFTTAANSVALTGSGWSDVYTITRTGQPQPLAIAWTGATTWSTTITLVAGANVIALAAFDQHGTATGTDTITITSSTANVAASSVNIVISEVHYHPADPSGAEFTAGYDDADDFQFIELHNISAAAVELAGSSFSQGLAFTFTASTVLPPGGVRVLARDAAAFQMRYGFAPGGTFTGRLSHADETITLLSATSAVIESFRYEDSDPWPASADGPGYSLQLIRPRTNSDATLPQNWTSSAAIGGSPGTVEDITYAAWLAQFPTLTLDDQDGDSLSNALEYALRTNPLAPNTSATAAAIQPIAVLGVTANYFTHTFRRHIGATSATWTPQFSPDLSAWQAADFTLHGSVNNGDGTENVTYRTTSPVSTSKGFGRLRAAVE